MSILDKILEETASVDATFLSISPFDLGGISFDVNVPSKHFRYQQLKQYTIRQSPRENIIGDSPNEYVFLLDRNLLNVLFVTNILNQRGYKYLVLDSREGTTKTLSFLDTFIHSMLSGESFTTLIVIGGGLLTNCGAYICEQMNKSLVLVPSTVLSMADNSGGKVRINNIVGEKFYKHFYKSFYEPDAIIIDRRFLSTLSLNEKKNGLVEIIKHALFQSPALYDYLLQNREQLLQNDYYLMEAILWTIALKIVCIKYDIDEHIQGSKKILRAGHEISDHIEEDMKFSIPHGHAVAIGIIKELQQENDQERLDRAILLFNSFGISYTL